jgi:hypothetical protein|tara:strand:- start:8642 stop:8932 length:291 start_codon:yes stop_codon:yes gene_type:complete
MSSHAKEITGLKDNIPKLLFLTTGKMTKQFQETEAFVNRAKLEIEADNKMFRFEFSTEDDKTIKTNFQILDAEGESKIDVEGIHDGMGPPINDTIN